MANINFINECKNRANGNSLGKIIVDNHEITNSDNLQSFSIDSGYYIDGNQQVVCYVDGEYYNSFDYQLMKK